MKKRIGISLGVLVLLLGFVGTWLLFVVDGTPYYTQIANDNVQSGDTTGGVVQYTPRMAYIYTLPAYDENGNVKDITFGADKLLRDNAFLRVMMVPFRGAIAWQEVTYTDLPEAVQQQYGEPETPTE